MVARRFKFFILLTIFSFVSVGLYAQEAEDLYWRGANLAKAKDEDFAFMYFNRIVQDFPKSKFAKGALFATGEYYFLTRGYMYSSRAFEKYLNSYPESKVNLFSLMYLLEIARHEELEDLVKKIEKEIIAFQQLSLIFRDFKEYEYQSGLDRDLKAVYYIDKVEFYIDGQFFTKVSY